MDAIDGKYLHVKGIGTVWWSWTHDEGQLRSNNLKDLLYFTKSLVKILIETDLYRSIKYDRVIWALTKIKNYVFTWYFRKHTKTIVHS